MRNKCVQVSLFDDYESVATSLEENKPRLFRQLDEHIEWECLPSPRFYRAFYSSTGRPRKYELCAFLKALVLQRIFGYTEDSQLLLTLRHSSEMRRFCGFEKVPDAAKLTRFKQRFQPYLAELFESLVEKTEPICREMNAELADCLIFDSTGIESFVAENNPKFLNSKLSQAKTYAKTNPGYDPYRGVYALMPDHASANPMVKRQYVNGHFCYAQKAGLLVNGLGIVRHIELFDRDFLCKHADAVTAKTSGSPNFDKELGDSKALLPVLSDFREAHPALRFRTFLGDAAFDSYDNYSALLGEYGFCRAVIPLNIRNAANKASPELNEYGIPRCPSDNSPMVFHSCCGGRNRSKRFKFICPRTERVKSEHGMTWRCRCEQPCSTAAYGRTVYIYPDEDKRLYPGILRGTAEWDLLYNRRVAVERSIGAFKAVLCLQDRKTFHSLTTKTDLYLAGIVQLICVILADAIHSRRLIRSVRKLAA